MKNKMLKKLGVIGLSAVMCTSMLPVSTIYVYAGADVKGEIVVNAERGATVTVDNVEATYEDADLEPVYDPETDQDSDPDNKHYPNNSQFYENIAVNASGGSKVTVNGDINVSVEGRAGWDLTTAVYARENSKVDVNGDIKVDSSNLEYTHHHENNGPLNNVWYARGIDNTCSEVDVANDVVVSANGDAQGVLSSGGTTTIHGSIKISGKNENGYIVGAHLSHDVDANQPGLLIVDGDLNIQGGSNAIGLELTNDAKAYIKGDMTLEALREIKGVGLSGNAIAVVDGTLSVKATSDSWIEARIIDLVLSSPGATLDGTTIDDNTCLYVYQYVDNTKYLTGIHEVEMEDEDGSYIATFVGQDRPEKDQNSPHLKYIIRTDDNVSTNASIFSDADLGIKGFYYGAEGDRITVSGKGTTIYGIKNAEEGIDIKVSDNGDGTWTIIIPKGGGVHLQAILEKVGRVVESSSGVYDAPTGSIVKKPPVIIQAVTMTPAQIAESVTGSTEYLAKQAELAAAMTQALNDVETMTAEQFAALKTTGLSIDAGGCTVADAKVSQLVIRALNMGIPVNMSVIVNGKLVKFTIPAGFDMTLCMNTDGTIDFLKLISVMRIPL